MNLQLAIVLSCTDKRCQVRLLDEGTCFDTDYSESVMEYRIIVRPGDLVAVDRELDPPQVVFRWSLAKVVRVENQQIFIDLAGGRSLSLARAEGLEVNIAKGDSVFFTNGKVHDKLVNGQPASPEHLRATFFPEIRAMYQQMEAWNALDPKQVVEQGYDCIAESYLEWLHSARLEERARYTAVLFDQLSPGDRVLDLGCGAGVPTTQELARQFQVTGVDISKHQIELARQNVPATEFIHADIAQLDFPPSSFDAVIAFYAFIHIPRQEHSRVLQNIHSWLRPGGLFVATMGTRSVKRDFGEDYLGTRMFWSGFDSETNKRLVEETGLRILRAQEETAVEFDKPVTFLWVIANKPNADT
jgi:SAM-dependent methyltransferase